MKPVLFHSINLPQQEGLEEKSGWRTMRWTREYFFTSDDLYKSSAAL